MAGRRTTTLPWDAWIALMCAADLERIQCEKRARECTEQGRADLAKNWSERSATLKVAYDALHKHDAVSCGAAPQATLRVVQS